VLAAEEAYGDEPDGGGWYWDGGESGVKAMVGVETGGEAGPDGEAEMEAQSRGGRASTAGLGAATCQPNV
jgi:hypothetical protein